MDVEARLQRVEAEDLVLLASDGERSPREVVPRHDLD
jgi:hypothetical protein